MATIGEADMTSEAKGTEARSAQPYIDKPGLSLLSSCVKYDEDCGDHFTLMPISQHCAPEEGGGTCLAAIWDAAAAAAGAFQISGRPPLTGEIYGLHPHAQNEKQPGEEGGEREMDTKLGLVRVRIGLEKAYFL